MASYNLAVLYLSGAGSGVTNACNTAVELLKKVSERGWASLSEASTDFENGEYGWSLYNYLKVADIGVELAQNNAAWMLQHSYGYQGYRSDDLASYLYKLSASQGNSEALIPLGDAYWYGRGLSVDLRKAGSLYTAASKMNHPRALFNLGYMHQYGLGMPKDMHIAKRYYDQAMQASPGAYLPSMLAVTWLQLHHAWDIFCKPRLPIYISNMFSPLFDTDRVGPPEVTLFARTAKALYTPLQGFVSLGNTIDTIEEAMDSTLFIWIIAFIGLLVWKSRRRGLERVVEDRGDQRPFHQAAEPPGVPLDPNGDGAPDS